MFFKLIISLVFTLHLCAEDFYMLNYTLADMRTNEGIDLNRFKGKELFLTFYKNDCSWCEKQLGSFDELIASEHGSEIAVVAVAIGDDKYRLIEMAKDLKYPVLSASKKLLDDIGGVRVTPYTLIADKYGNFKTKIVGYQDKKQLDLILHKYKGVEK